MTWPYTRPCSKPWVLEKQGTCEALNTEARSVQTVIILYPHHVSVSSPSSFPPLKLSFYLFLFSTNSVSTPSLSLTLSFSLCLTMSLFRSPPHFFSFQLSLSRSFSLCSPPERPRSRIYKCSSYRNIRIVFLGFLAQCVFIAFCLVNLHCNSPNLHYMLLLVHLVPLGHVSIYYFAPRAWGMPFHFTGCLQYCAKVLNTHTLHIFDEFCILEPQYKKKKHILKHYLNIYILKFVFGMLLKRTRYYMKDTS